VTALRGCVALVASFVCASAAWAQPLRVGPEFQVNTYTTYSQFSPSVGVAASGDFVLTWQSYGQDGTGYGIFARRFASTGVPFETADFQVNTYGTSHQFSPSVSVAPSGDFVVTWVSLGQDGSGDGIFVRRFASSGVPLDTADFQVNTYTTSDQYSHSVGVAASGDSVVAWESLGQDGSGFGIFARRFASSGVPLNATDFQVNTYTTSNQRLPSVGVTGNGDFVVTWESRDQDGSGAGIFARRFASTGVALDMTDFQVNTYTTYGQRSPSVSVAPSGDFVVAWESRYQDGSGYGIFARRFDSSGGALDTTDFQVNTYTTLAQSGPSVSVTGSGDFVVAWQSYDQDGSYHGIFARRFASKGVPLDTTEFQVNTYTTSGQARPSVGVAPSGDFVVAWDSDGQIGSSSGIFAQQFSCDTDGDGLCDAEDIILTNPLDGGTVDCRTPGLQSSRPLITWYRGNYVRFRVQVAWDPAFPKAQRITSGDTLLTSSKWKPGADAWRRFCNNAGADAYIRVFGVDLQRGKSHPLRKTFSNDVSASVLN